MLLVPVKFALHVFIKAGEFIFISLLSRILNLLVLEHHQLMLLHLLLLKHLIQILHLFTSLNFALQGFRVVISLLLLNILSALIFSQCSLCHFLSMLLITQACKFQLFIVVIHLLPVQTCEVIFQDFLLFFHGFMQLLLLLHFLHQLFGFVILLFLFKLLLLLSHLDIFVQLIPNKIITMADSLTDTPVSYVSLAPPGEPSVSRVSPPDA